jgi:hypothetical protein
VISDCLLFPEATIFSEDPLFSPARKNVGVTRILDPTVFVFCCRNCLNRAPSSIQLKVR